MENIDIPLTTPEMSQSAQDSKFPITQEPQSEIPQKDKESQKIAVYALILIALLTLGIFGLWFYQGRIFKKSKPSPSASPIPSTTPSIMPTKIPDITMETDETCKLKPDPGICKAYMPRYYFDESEDTCKEFIWGGCGGTVPFETLESCIEACEKGKNSKVVDYSLCQENSGYQEYVGFGSTYLTIKKDLGNTCEIEISNEVEGSYTVYRCNIPKSIGKMSIAINIYGSDFSSILQYCKEIKSGNVLMELQD